MLKKTILYVGLSFCFTVFIVYECLAEGSGTTGAIILKQSICSRAEGMGGAFVAVADDIPGGVFINPAGLYMLEKREVTASGYRGIADDTFCMLGYGHPLNSKYTLGVGLLNYDAGNMDLVGANGETRNVKAQSDWLVNVSCAYEIILGLSAGAGLKVINSTLAEEATATAFAIDLGALYMLDMVDNLNVGLAIQNIGTKLKYKEEGDTLPFTIRAGVAYDAITSSQKKPEHDLLLAADLNKVVDTDLRLDLGAEYWYKKMAACRVGYKVGYDLEGLTLGLGGRYLGFQLDYSFSLMEELDSTHHLSLSYRFDTPVNRLSKEDKRKKLKSEREKRKVAKKLEKLCKKGEKKYKEKKFKKALVKYNAALDIDPHYKKALDGKKKAKDALDLVTIPQILEIESIAGEVKSIIINRGSDNSNIKQGMKGLIYNHGRQLIGKFKIAEVYKFNTRAIITEINGEIKDEATVEIIVE